MDRSEILQMMAALQLSGMRTAYDEIVTTGIKRVHRRRRLTPQLRAQHSSARCCLHALHSPERPTNTSASRLTASRDRGRIASSKMLPEN